MFSHCTAVGPPHQQGGRQCGADNFKSHLERNPLAYYFLSSCWTSLCRKTVPDKSCVELLMAVNRRRIDFARFEVFPCWRTRTRCERCAVCGCRTGFLCVPQTGVLACARRGSAQAAGARRQLPRRTAAARSIERSQLGATATRVAAYSHRHGHAIRIESILTL